MSGRVHTIGQAVHILGALYQDAVITEQERIDYAQRLHTSIRDDSAYHDLLYRIRFAQIQAEQEDKIAAARLWGQFYAAVEGSQSQ